jgi:hypothetical protein
MGVKVLTYRVERWRGSVQGVQGLTMSLLSGECPHRAVRCPLSSILSTAIFGLKA